MLRDLLKSRDFSTELMLTATRSSGPGGQNVNKVSTKVELRFNVKGSSILTLEEKDILLARLAKRINSEGELVLTAQRDRSQLKNKEKVVEKFYTLVANALTPVKKRKPTKPPMAAIEKRLEEKQAKSEKKERRRKV